METYTPGQVAAEIKEALGYFDLDEGSGAFTDVRGAGGGNILATYRHDDVDNLFTIQVKAL